MILANDNGVGIVGIEVDRNREVGAKIVGVLVNPEIRAWRWVAADALELVDQRTAFVARTHERGLAF
jgi:hypothetical protein